MIMNIYQRHLDGQPVGKPVPGGWWDTQEEADRASQANENRYFKRVLVVVAPKQDNSNA